MPAAATAAETVVLVHGLWMRGFVFLLQHHRLERLGFAVRSFSYPTRAHLAQNASALARFVTALDASAIHLVGHSLGGLVILAMLARHADPRLRRAVLMGTPCRACHCAAALLRRPWLAAVVGASLRDWLAAPALPPPASVDIGVVAGSRSLGVGRAIPGLPRPNDGVVAVAETRLDGARDAITLPVAHTEMLVSVACAVQIAAFLRTGRFLHA